ncbi:MAG TPA: hypothetical protein VD926_14315 [Acidimicrobiales bacterium]|nr:hypothetical protein [Acidimicrobiales bacterium]
MSRAVAAAVRELLPTPTATAALAAALWDGDEGRAVFERWSAHVGDPRDLPPDERHVLRELAPQLDAARRRVGARAPGALGVLLHAATVHERRRWASYRAAAVDLLAGEAEPLVSGGLAVALSAHAEPAERHCHDLDRLGRDPRNESHPSGLPGVVHAGLLPPGWTAEEDLDAIRGRSAPDDRLGRPVRRIGVGDLLVAVLVHHVAGRRWGSVRWASDAWLLAASASDADWACFTGTVVGQRLGPVVLPSLRYVADDLRGAVPVAVRDAVAASPPPDAERARRALAWAHRHRSPTPTRRLVRAVRRRLTT